MENKEIIVGGLGDGRSDKEFDQQELSAGIKVEMEHTNDVNVAKEIAKDHLTEDPLYYQKLETIEEKKDRNQICESIDQELLLRKYISQFLKKNFSILSLKEQKEQKEDKPLYSFTSMNLLSELLEKIVPIIEENYKILTTSEEQRISFEEYILNSINEKYKKIDISSDEADEEQQDWFIDIYKNNDNNELENSQEKQDVGERIGEETYLKIDKDISESFSLLQDDKEYYLFKKYLLKNLEEYFNIFDKKYFAQEVQ